MVKRFNTSPLTPAGLAVVLSNVDLQTAEQVVRSLAWRQETWEVVAEAYRRGDVRTLHNDVLKTIERHGDEGAAFVAEYDRREAHPAARMRYLNSRAKAGDFAAASSVGAWGDQPPGVDPIELPKDMEVEVAESVIGPGFASPRLLAISEAALLVMLNTRADRDLSRAFGSAENLDPEACAAVVKAGRSTTRLTYADLGLHSHALAVRLRRNPDANLGAVMSAAFDRFVLRLSQRSMVTPWKADALAAFADTVLDLARFGVTPSPAALAQPLSVARLNAEPVAAPFEQAFSLSYYLHSAQEKPCTLWAALAGRGAVEALELAITAGRDIAAPHPHSGVTLLDAVIQFQPPRCMGAFLIEHNADGQGVLPDDRMASATRAVVYAGRAQRLLTQSPFRPAVAPL